VSIHIADVAPVINPGSALDLEARERVETTYVGDAAAFPMVPWELIEGALSLKEGEERLAVTLSVVMNDNGVVDFSTAAYSLTVIKSA